MFSTPVHIAPSPHKIFLRAKILSIGSCFAQVIGQQLQENKFDTFINPFGTLYNPAALFRMLHQSINQMLPSEETYLVREGMHYNYKFHSDFSAPHRKDLEAQIEQAITSTHQFLEMADWLLITLGTAFSYEKVDTQLLVSNCHKMPASHFHKRMLEVEEISLRFDQLLRAMDAFNPRLRYIFTVSPVRHIRDTLQQNSVSKASLRVAVDLIQQKHADKVFYFPSYEIMMDELRDYRFYKADMIHPSEVAEHYIWEKFASTYLDKEALQFIANWEKLKKAIQHKPFHPESSHHQNFLKKTITQLQQLSNKVDVSQEISYLEKQLK